MRAPTASRVPDVAWPTLALLLTCLVAWIAALGCLAWGWLPVPLAAVLATLASYATFTPMHEASHRSVGRAPGLAAVVGRVAGLPLLVPYPAFRYLHLEHHRHTNDAARDPDHWCAIGPWPLLPLRWLTLDLHYYARYLALRDRPRAERAEVIATALALWSGVIALALAGYGDVALWGLFVPTRLANALLAFAFDWLPHAPHDVRGDQDRFAATRLLPPALAIPLLGQSYHLIHHIWPTVPFYKYAEAFRETREALVQRGARGVN